MNLPWYIAGGWAIDLHLGRETRAHEDLEFCVLKQDQPAFLKLLSELEFFAAFKGKLYPLSHELGHQAQQFWGFETDGNVWRVDMMIENGTAQTWVYKRAAELTAPRTEAVLISDQGVPYLHPKLVLLFKAKRTRDKDHADFEHVLPELSRADKDWLVMALTQLHPEHSWIAKLNEFTKMESSNSPNLTKM